MNGMSYASAILGLGEIQYAMKSFLDRPQDFKLVLFTGGADITPSLYGDTSPDGYCYNNPERDLEEKRVFETCIKHDIPMAGICRGLQFLNVMHGGKMMHHLDGHEGGRTHRMLIEALNEEIMINTLHHQMILPSGKAHIIGSTFPRLSNVYYGAADMEVDYQGVEIEAAIFPEIRAVGVQYHPEMMDERSHGYAFFYNLVKATLEMPIDEVVRIYTRGDSSFDYIKIRHGNVHSAV